MHSVSLLGISQEPRLSNADSRVSSFRTSGSLAWHAGHVFVHLLLHLLSCFFYFYFFFSRRFAVHILSVLSTSVDIASFRNLVQVTDR